MGHEAVARRRTRPRAGDRRLGPAPDAPGIRLPRAPWFEPSKPCTQNFPDPAIARDGSTHHAHGTEKGGSYLPVMTSTGLVTWTARPKYNPGASKPTNEPFFNDALPCARNWAYPEGGHPDWSPTSRRPRW